MIQRITQSLIKETVDRLEAYILAVLAEEGYVFNDRNKLELFAKYRMQIHIYGDWHHLYVDGRPMVAWNRTPETTFTGNTISSHWKIKDIRDGRAKEDS